MSMLYLPSILSVIELVARIAVWVAVLILIPRLYRALRIYIGKNS